MSRISYQIDWITATMTEAYTNMSEAVDKLRAALGERDWWEPDRVPPPYKQGVESDIGVICWSDDYPEFGVMFRAGGANLRKMRLSGVADVEAIKSLMGLGWGFKRLDLALDIYDAGGRPKEIYDLWRTGKLATHARTVTIFQESNNQGETKGETVYIGSRKTQQRRLVRIYDKAAERGVSGDWIRVELELTDKYAQSAASSLSGGENITRVFADFLHSAVPHGLPEWIRKAVDVEFSVVQIEADTHTNFERWFTKIILPAVEKAVGGEVPDAERLLLNAIRSGKARAKGREMSPRS